MSDITLYYRVCSEKFGPISGHLERSGSSNWLNILTCVIHDHKPFMAVLAMCVYLRDNDKSAICHTALVETRLSKIKQLATVLHTHVSLGTI